MNLANDGSAGNEEDKYVQSPTMYVAVLTWMLGMAQLCAVRTHTSLPARAKLLRLSLRP